MYNDTKCNRKIVLWQHWLWKGSVLSQAMIMICSTEGEREKMISLSQNPSCDPVL